jgi:uncharacterized protein YndB with AHSA1/START domain
VSFVTRKEIDSRPALRLERGLPHPVDRVWRAVTEPAELERWFVGTVPWTPLEGEAFEAGGFRGQITELVPLERLAWQWGPERYAFVLAPAAPGCVLVFTHVFDPQMGPDWQHAAGWDAYFDRLEAHVDGGYLSEEDAHAGSAARAERYRREFGAG